MSRISFGNIFSFNFVTSMYVVGSTVIFISHQANDATSIMEEVKKNIIGIYVMVYSNSNHPIDHSHHKYHSQIVVISISVVHPHHRRQLGNFEHKLSGAGWIFELQLVCHDLGFLPPVRVKKFNFKNLLCTMCAYFKLLPIERFSGVLGPMRDDVSASLMCLGR